MLFVETRLRATERKLIKAYVRFDNLKSVKPESMYMLNNLIDAEQVVRLLESKRNELMRNLINPGSYKSLLD